MKAVKFVILKPTGETTWKELGQTFRDIQYKTAKILNYCMTEWFLYEKERDDWNKEHGKYPTAKDKNFPTITTVVKKMYKESRERFPELGSRMVTAVINKSKQRWQTDRKEVYYSMKKSLPSFRKTHPIVLDNQSITYSKEDLGYVFRATILSNKSEGIKRCSVVLATKKLTGSQRFLLKGIFDKSIKSKSAMIGYNERKRKWSVTIAYEPPEKDIALDSERIVGVDMGVTCPFYCAISDSNERLSVRGWEIQKFRKTIRARRQSFQRSSKVSTRLGQGRKKILKPVESLSRKERRFRDTKYHQYSKAIVNFAVKNNAGVIQIENLDSLKATKQDNFILKDWALADLQNKLKYKAKLNNIEVVEVAPRYTSQRCSACGYISSKNRPSQSLFACQSCGYEENADYNAAKNLSIKGIDDLITKEIANPERTENT